MNELTIVNGFFPSSSGEGEQVFVLFVYLLLELIIWLKRHARLFISTYKWHKNEETGDREQIIFVLYVSLLFIFFCSFIRVGVSIINNGMSYIKRYIIFNA